MSTLTQNSINARGLNSSRKFMGITVGVSGANPTSVLSGGITITGAPAGTSGVSTTGSRWPTAASIGAVAGVSTTSLNLTYITHDPDFECWTGNAVAGRFENARTWVGLHDFDPANAADAGNVHISFRYADLDGDTGWVGSVNDGTTHTTTSTIASYALDSRLKIRVDSANNLAYFSVNNGVETSLDISGFSATQNLGMLAMIVTTVAANKDVILSRMTLETN